MESTSSPPLGERATSTIPIADYFFICGFDTSNVFPSESNDRSTAGHSSTLDSQAEAEPSLKISATGELPDPRGRDRDGPRIRHPYVHEKEGNKVSVTASKRSNTTSIGKGGTSTTEVTKEQMQLGEENNFDAAIEHFASDRESFLREINTQPEAGQAATSDESRPLLSTISVLDDTRKDAKGAGSIRRKLSLISPLSRNPTQRSSQRQSKRVSGYNSVMLSPQRLKASATMHPLKRPYEPVLLDQYPFSHGVGTVNSRQKFPDFVPMFVFPNDVSIVASRAPPRATWHGFTMTGADGAKLHGTCLITWKALSPLESAKLEKKCDEWRSLHMSDEEREVARDLNERLTAMRAKLSELLSRLPQIPFATQSREAHEEEISNVEERIALMNDALPSSRHGSSTKIDGLLDGTAAGFWIPRAYGILGRDGYFTGFWKEWLRVITVPMIDSSLLRVPPSSSSAGLWLPLEKYVMNLCTEAPIPISSRVQVELTIRELRLHARKEATNEIPGSRNVDLYPLFRCLNLPDIVVLFEYVLAESRIILLSSHTSMLSLISAAIVQLLYPLKWLGAYVPVLPARLIEMLEAPCPYIFGIDRRYANFEFPTDDIVLVDLDSGVIEATEPPTQLPRQQRRKLLSTLQLACPLHSHFGVPLGPPPYAIDAYPFDTFPSENRSIYSPSPPPSNIAHLASLRSTLFGASLNSHEPQQPLHNVFSTGEQHRRSQSIGRSTTSPDQRTSSSSSPSHSQASVSSSKFDVGNNHPVRHDPAYALQNSLREKRSGQITYPAGRSSKSGYDGSRRPSILPFYPGHNATSSAPTIVAEGLGDGHTSMSDHPPSLYAPSTLAASSMVPETVEPSVKNVAARRWYEGHRLEPWRDPGIATCSICEESAEGSFFRCTGCSLRVHLRCTDTISLACPTSFHPDQIMAAFARCFASLFYTYRKYVKSGARVTEKEGQRSIFEAENFQKSLHPDHAEYISTLRETQAFNQFIDEVCSETQTYPSVRLFDSIIAAKRARSSKPRMFSRSTPSSRKPAEGFLTDTSTHLWVTASAPAPTMTQPSLGMLGNATAVASVPRRHTTQEGVTAAHSYSKGQNRGVVLPGKLNSDLMREPRAVQGVPQIRKGGREVRRKLVPLEKSPL